MLSERVESSCLLPTLAIMIDLLLVQAVKIREIIGLRLIRFEMNTIKSLGCERSNAEALSVVPFFSPSAQTPDFARPTYALPVFFRSALDGL